ncbi:helix-turn-helix domain-containing protein [Azospirillum agricola]|uniref:helix-turn-helix domain-containing protein n=1 Tax=Azospirillum agricola TaxID=1720247 RepID=UPI000A0F00C6|nr:transcriptional regulator [Azospirillum agricola]SMH60463.1 Helix-turn-helix [Azospirillum lipoferum]
MELNYVQQELRRRREAAGLSQRGLSLLVGDNDSLVKKIENGLSKNPRIDTLKALAEALNCKVSDLTGDPDEPSHDKDEGKGKAGTSTQNIDDLTIGDENEIDRKFSELWEKLNKSTKLKTIKIMEILLSPEDE